MVSSPKYLDNKDNHLQLFLLIIRGFQRLLKPMWWGRKKKRKCIYGRYVFIKVDHWYSVQCSCYCFCEVSLLTFISYIRNYNWYTILGIYVHNIRSYLPSFCFMMSASLQYSELVYRVSSQQQFGVMRFCKLCQPTQPDWGIFQRLSSLWVKKFPNAAEV